MISYNEIEDRIFLGSRPAAEDYETLCKLGIAYILTVDSQPLRKKFDDINYFHLHAFDEPETDLLSHFEETYHFIDEARATSSPCLVHCFVGMSRSATIVIAYLMKKHLKPLKEVLQLVQSKRNLVCPNSGFVSQLYLYETMMWQIKKENLQYRLLQLMKLSRIFLKSRQSDVLKNYTASSEKLSDQDEEFKCRRCRVKLFNSHNILRHFIGQPMFWDDIRWLQYPNVDQNQLCKVNIFVEPLPWMLPSFVSPQGKIFCSKCETKLGSFSWSGMACACGQQMLPGLHIVESKIDRSRPSVISNIGSNLLTAAEH